MQDILSSASNLPLYNSCLSLETQLSEGVADCPVLCCAVLHRNSLLEERWSPVFGSVPMGQSKISVPTVAAALSKRLVQPHFLSVVVRQRISLFLRFFLWPLSFLAFLGASISTCEKLCMFSCHGLLPVKWFARSSLDCGISNPLVLSLNHHDTS